MPWNHQSLIILVWVLSTGHNEQSILLHHLMRAYKVAPFSVYACDLLAAL
jgi:hypothetical protein